jgi:hypothetical protein
MLLCWGGTWQVEAEPACRHDAPSVLTFEEGLLSLEAKNICLGILLEALAEQSYAQIHLSPSIADKPVSASFKELPLEQAIKHILRDTSYALQTKSKHGFWAEDSPATSEGVEIWLAPKEAVVSDQPSSLSEGQEKLIDLAALAEQSRFAPEPETRTYAVQLIAQTSDRAKAAQILLTSLQDSAPQVRCAALMTMAELNSAVTASAMDGVADMALHDENPEVRKRALLKLINEDFWSEATSTAMTRALYDKNPAIQEVARELSKLLDK